jgi:signal transduction histidine kinase
LWISREIIARHQGSLKVKSRHAPHHSGTIFTLMLPCDD